MCEDFVYFQQLVAHVEKNGTFLEGDEVHNAICENNCVLDIIVEPLEDPDLYYIINET
jgi:hypothetical protein